MMKGVRRFELCMLIEGSWLSSGFAIRGSAVLYMVFPQCSTSWLEAAVRLPSGIHKHTVTEIEAVASEWTTPMEMHRVNSPKSSTHVAHNGLSGARDACVYLKSE